MAPPGDLTQLAASSRKVARGSTRSGAAAVGHHRAGRHVPAGAVPCFFRWHHALVDGMSAMEIAYVLFDTQPDVADGRACSVAAASISQRPGTARGVDGGATRSQQWQDGLDRLVDLLYPGRAARFSTGNYWTGSCRSSVYPWSPTLPLAAAPAGPSRTSFADLDGDLLRPVQRRHDVSAHALSVGLVAGALARWAGASGGHAQSLRALIPVVVPVRDRGISLGQPRLVPGGRPAYRSYARSAAPCPCGGHVARRPPGRPSQGVQPS